MNEPRVWATIRGFENREELQEALKTETLLLISPLAVRAYRVDVSTLTPEQVSWLTDKYGVMIPANEFTISVK